MKHGRNVIELTENHPGLTSPNRSFATDFIANRLFAEVLMNHRRWEEAIDTFDRAIYVRSVDNTGITPALAYIGKAHCFWRIGKADHAWELLETYIKSRDTYPRPEESWKYA